MGLVSPPRLGGERCCQSSQQAGCHRSNSGCSLAVFYVTASEGLLDSSHGASIDGTSQWGARRGTRRDRSDRDPVGRARSGHRGRAPVDGIPLFSTAREATHVRSFLGPIQRGLASIVRPRLFSCSSPATIDWVSCSFSVSTGCGVARCATGARDGRRLPNRRRSFAAWRVRTAADRPWIRARPEGPSLGSVGTTERSQRS